MAHGNYTYYRHGPRHQNWQDGEIAFLSHPQRFNARDYSELIESGYLETGACAHPVIILKRLSSNSVLVTPVSAYNSDASNGFLAPWKAPWHAKRDKRDYRHFVGSEPPPSSYLYPGLHLRNGRSMPLARTSWLCVQSVWEVPLSVISPFNRTEGFPRLTPASLAQLQRDVAKNCRWYDASWGLHDTASNCNSSSTAATVLTSDVAALKLQSGNGGAHVSAAPAVQAGVWRPAGNTASGATAAQRSAQPARRNKYVMLATAAAA